MLKGDRAVKELAHASSLCGACHEVCPVRIDIPRMLIELRQRLDRERIVPLTERLLGLLRKQPPHTPDAAPVQDSTGCPCAFIIGFGPAGQRVADQLLENGIAAVVLELNPKSAAVARARGLKVHMVDATSSEAIAHVGLQDDCLVIVTVPDPRSSEEIIRNIRFFAPQSLIIARSRYHIASPNLQAAGASQVVDEENTIGDELAREVVGSLKRTNREALGCALAGEKP